MCRSTKRRNPWESHSLAGKQSRCISILYQHCGESSLAITVFQNSPDPPCPCRDRHCVSWHFTLHHGRDYSNSDPPYLDSLTREQKSEEHCRARGIYITPDCFIIVITIFPTWEELYAKMKAIGSFIVSEKTLPTGKIRVAENGTCKRCVQPQIK